MLRVVSSSNEDVSRSNFQGQKSELETGREGAIGWQYPKKKGDCRFSKSPTDSLQDIDGLLIIHVRKTNGEQPLGGKSGADFNICLLLREEIEVQVPLNQKNLLYIQGFSPNYQKGNGGITTKWKQSLKRKKK